MEMNLNASEFGNEFVNEWIWMAMEWIFIVNKINFMQMNLKVNFFESEF